MDSEVFQRATALASLIEGMSTDEQQAWTAETPDEELRWSASVLIAKVWRKGRFLLPQVRNADLEQELGATRVTDLRERRLLRTIVGQEVPTRIFGFDGARQLADDDARDLKRIREMRRDPARRRIWIAADVLRELYAAHALVQPATPTFELVISRAFEAHAVEGIDGYWLMTERGEKSLPPMLVALAGARVWLDLEKEFDKARDHELLGAWLDQMRCATEGIVPAVRFLDHNARARMVRAAAALIHADTDSGGLAEELRLRTAVRASNPRTSVPLRQSIAALHVFWDDFGESFDETRTMLHLLVLLIVTYDSDAQGRRQATLDLVEAGIAKPYLVASVAWYLRFQHAQLIASLLTRTPTVAFGLAVLADVKLQEPTMMDGWEQREARTQTRRLALFREALPLAARTLVVGGDAGGGTLIDVLRVMARRCVRALPQFENPQAATAARNAEELFALTLSHVTEARSPQSRTPQYEPLLLAEHFDEVLTELVDAFPEHETTAQLKVGLALLQFVRERVGAFTIYAEGTREKLESRLDGVLVKQYRRALELDEPAKDFQHFFPSPSLTDLPWHHLAVSLSVISQDALAEWLVLADLEQRLRTASQNAGEKDDLVSGIVERLRTHLTVLLHLHGKVSLSAATGGVDRTALKRRVEDQIERLVLATTNLASGAVNLFDRSLSYNVDDTARVALIERSVRALDEFPTNARARILERWLDLTNDPTVLMALSGDDAAPEIKSKVGTRLSDPTILQTAVQGLSFDVLTAMTANAAAGNYVTLAEGLLSHGAKVMAKHPWRSQWELTAFRARLLLAYHRRDRAAVEALALPSLADGSAGQTQRSTLESSRTFYKALLDLESNAEDARASFAAQLAREPESPSLLVNLFAAELRVAAGVTDRADRRAAYESALRAWQRRTAGLSDRERLEPNGTLNELIALDAAEQDDAFDQAWNSLGEAKQTRLDLTKVRVENLRRRDATVAVKDLLETVRVRFGGTIPEELKESSGETSAAVTEVEASINYYERWHQIKNLPPHELAKLLAPTGSTGTADLVRHLHMNAAFELVKRRLSVEVLWKEDNINDVLASFIDMQVSAFGWTVPDQPRAGASSTGKEPGRRDWTIKSGRQEVAVAEGLRLRSVETQKIQDHVTRLVEKYNPQGAGTTCLVVYFEGKSFSTFCNAYRAKVSAISFGKWTLKKQGEWSERWSSNTIRTFRVTLSDGDFTLVMDHILIDLMLGLDELTQA